jgi:Peptidase M15
MKRVQFWVICCMVMLVLIAPSLFALKAEANDGKVVRVDPAPAKAGVASPFADAEDDAMSARATQPPLNILPNPEHLARLPILTFAPLPPRRPAAPPAAGISEAEADSEVMPEDEPASAPEQRASLSAPSLPQLSTPQDIEEEEAKAPEPSVVEKQTDAVNIACLAPELMAIIERAGAHFKGTPIITSGQRQRGRLGSYHRKCMAADFFIEGVERATLAKYLRGLTGSGGVGTYCHTRAVHIDTGEPRNWYQCGFRFRFSQR